MKTRNDSRTQKAAGRKAQTALALAVSLWMANGAFWAPGVASAEQETEVTIKSKADADSKVAEGKLRKIENGPGADKTLYSLNNGTKMMRIENCTGASFYAGYSGEGGEASGYTLTVDNGTFSDKELAGGYSYSNSPSGTANNNNVYINGGEGGASVYGGRGQVDASGNTVAITRGTVGEVTGGFAYYGNAGGDSADAGNKVTISGGNVKMVYGGVSHEGKATGNSVTVSGGTTIGKGVFGDGVYGGRVYSTINGAGDAEKNIVTVSGGTIDGSVYGGIVCSNTAEDTYGATAATSNTVTISETDTAVPTIIKTEIYGGFSAKGAANENTVTISGGAIGTGDTNNVYGGYGYTGTSENKVTISGGKMSGQVYGGYTTGATGAANKNVLEISGGTVNRSVTGGYVDSLDAAATAAGNTVTIEGGTVNGDVNGGFASSATDNTVTISGGTIKNLVYGGRGSTKATDNTVTISGGTIDSNGIYGGYSDFGAANDNTVEISGGTFKNKPYIYGGSSNEGKATGNTVKISVANFEAGRICVGDGATSTGNTLVLDAKGIDVDNNVGGVQTIALTKNVKFEDNTTVLKAGKFAIDNNAATTLDISAASFAGDGAMTLLEVTSGNEDDNLATMTVAYKDDKGQAQTGTLTVDTPVQIKAGMENDTYAQNNVTLTYDSDVQQVAMKDAGQKVVFESGINGSVKDVAMGTVQWQKGSTAMDAAGAGFTLDGKTTLTDNLAIDFAGAEKDAAVNDTMTLLAANQEMATLSNDFRNFSRTIEKEYSVDTAGVSIDAKVTATATASGKSLTAAITANRATKLTFGDVKWLTDGALIDHKTALTNISFEGADVDTTNISFTNVSKLDDDAKMTLVSSFGTRAGKITGSDFTLGTLTGKGHAYWENNDLLYLVTEGAGGDTPGPTPTPGEDISGQSKTVEPGETVTKDVAAAKATGSKTATSNTATVSKGGTVGTKEKPANVTGATTESGAAKENAANITGGTVNGDVAGATTVSGDAAGNTATVTDGGVIVGSDPEEKPALVGAITESGKAEGNKANVTGGTVTGSVAGAVSGTGIVSSNTATVSGKSEVTGTVVGAAAKTGKLADGNSAEVSGRSTVTGNVAGAEAAKGEVSNNSASISEKSFVKGDVIGAVTKSGVAVANAVTVTGDSQIKKNDPESGEAKDKEVAGGDVIGAMTESGTASQNTVTVTESIVERDVSGANSTSGEVNTNTVTISGGEIGGSVFGGRTEGTKGAVGNGIVLEDAEVKGDVYGGMSEGGAADGNTAEISGEETVVKGNVFGASSKTASTGNSVTMKDGTVGGYVFGAVSKAATKNNIVTMTGGTVNGLVGGGCETATENYVSVEDGFVEQFAVGGLASKTATGNTVTMTGGRVYNGIYGGYGETGAASGNNVYLGGGTVSGISPSEAVTVDGFTLKEGGVYGGYSVSGTTQHNCVILYGTADVSTANLFGGNREATGNTLHLGYVADGTPIPWKGGESGAKVNGISNFETVSFDVVQWNPDTPALIVGGSTSNLSGTVSAKNVIFTGVDKLAAKDAMTLVKNLPATAKVEETSAFTIGAMIEGTGSLAVDGSDVKYTVESVGASKQTHNAVMSAEVGMAALSAGNDFIGNATEGLALASNIGADGVSTYAQMGGGTMRQETGSHVDTHTWNAILALGHQNKKEKSTTERDESQSDSLHTTDSKSLRSQESVIYGAFFEYGSGNYTTFNDAGQRGDGSMHYTGGGVLAKWTASHGFYVEGSLRAGTVHDDARNVLRNIATGVPYSYETDANYFGAHLGVGKEIALANGNTVDVYGKYFYNRKNGVSFNAGGQFDLDAVTSQILRVGARYTVKRDKWNFYAGAAYEHELDGKATGTAGGLAIRGAEISGASFRGELGATMKPDKNSPWSLDLNVAGFAGKKQGFTGGVSVAFMF